MKDHEYPSRTASLFLARHTLTLLGLAVAAPALAQQTAGENVGTLPGVIVSGTADTGTGPVQGYVAEDTTSGSKTDTPLREIPQSISVVGAQEMRDRGAQSVSQAIQYVPGVQITNFGGAEVRNDWVVL
ncbi:TonB-dependent receptor plug domain-containing protein, partial [Achromobacter xylosoxidans]